MTATPTSSFDSRSSGAEQPINSCVVPLIIISSDIISVWRGGGAMFIARESLSPLLPTVNRRSRETREWYVSRERTTARPRWPAYN